MSEQRGHNNRTNERPWSVSSPGGERGERGMEKMGEKEERTEILLGVQCLYSQNK